MSDISNKKAVVKSNKVENTTITTNKKPTTTNKNWFSKVFNSKKSNYIITGLAIVVLLFGATLAYLNRVMTRKPSTF